MSDEVRAAYAADTNTVESAVDFRRVYRRAAAKRRRRALSRAVPVAAAALLCAGLLVPAVRRRTEERQLLENAVAYQTELLFQERLFRNAWSDSVAYIESPTPAATISGRSLDWWQMEDRSPWWIDASTASAGE